MSQWRGQLFAVSFDDACDDDHGLNDAIVRPMPTASIIVWRWRDRRYCAARCGCAASWRMLRAAGARPRAQSITPSGSRLSLEFWIAPDCFSSRASSKSCLWVSCSSKSYCYYRCSKSCSLRFSYRASSGSCPCSPWRRLHGHYCLSPLKRHWDDYWHYL